MGGTRLTLQSECKSIIKKHCYFCDSIQEFNEYKTGGDSIICKNCGKIEGELYCPMIFDNCRICNNRIIIATGEQPKYKKNGYCSQRCAGEWTLGTSDSLPYWEMLQLG